MKGFWSIKEVFTTRRLTTMGLAVGFTAILAVYVNFYIAPGVRFFSLTYLPGAIISAIYGPIAGLTVGIAGDITGYLLNPSGGMFFPGFTLSAMLQNFVYALFLYRPVRPYGLRSQIARTILAQIIVLITVSLGLNMLWLGLLYGTALGQLYALSRIAIKLVQLPIDILLVNFCLQIARHFSKA